MTMSRKFVGTRFAQTVTPEQVDATYDRYIVPTAGKVYWDGLTSAAGKIRSNNAHRAPLMFIGGGMDLIAEAKMTKAMFEKQSRRNRTRSSKSIPTARTRPALMRAGKRLRTSRSTGLRRNARPLKTA